MTTEEKAIKYDEALERARKINKEFPTIIGSNICEEIFPELEESEDEKIRKTLIELVKCNERSGYTLLNNVPTSSMLAWLEKQDERKTPQWMIDFLENYRRKIGCSLDYDEYRDVDGKILCIKDWLEKQGTERKQLYIRFGDIPSNEKSKIYRGEEEIGDENGVSVYPAFELNGNIVLGLTLPITKTTLYTQQHLLEYDNRPCYLVSGDYVGNGTDGEPLIRNISIIKRLYNYRIKEVEKQEKQSDTNSELLNKFTDEDYKNMFRACNIPKFKVGDWITDGQLTCKVLNITSKSYELHLYNDDYCHFETDVQSVDKHYHLWTIKDAKDGDILTWDDSKCIALFKNIYDEDSFNSHGFVGHCTGSFETRLSYHDIEGAHPATKEQRDLLFAKMHEAGYAWDADKKELKNIKHKDYVRHEDKVYEKQKELFEKII